MAGDRLESVKQGFFDAGAAVKKFHKTDPVLAGMGWVAFFAMLAELGLYIASRNGAPGALNKVHAFLSKNSAAVLSVSGAAIGGFAVGILRMKKKKQALLREDLEAKPPRVAARDSAGEDEIDGAEKSKKSCGGFLARFSRKDKKPVEKPADGRKVSGGWRTWGRKKENAQRTPSLMLAAEDPENGPSALQAPGRDVPSRVKSKSGCPSLRKKRKPVDTVPPGRKGNVTQQPVDDDHMEAFGGDDGRGAKSKGDATSMAATRRPGEIGIE